MNNHLIVCGDALEQVKQLKPESVDLLVTSPPYWAKRIYNGDGELGSEETPEAYVKRLADCFDVFRPYLSPSANVFVNIGDTYFGSGAGAYSKYLDEQGNVTDAKKKHKEKFFVTKPLQPKIKRDGKLYQNKQLLMIPARFAIEMQSRRWILREDIIWHKPNRIPNGVADRFNNTYEHVFHFVLNKRYFFDLNAVKVMGQNGRPKNPGDVWSINTQPLHGNHTATFPEALVERIILCASPRYGVVFDPFLGVGTTWVVADRLNRSCVGFEINEEYYAAAHERFAAYRAIEGD